MAEWKARDPIARFARVLREQGMASEEEIARAELEATESVDEAVRFALSSPWPTADELLSHVLA